MFDFFGLCRPKSPIQRVTPENFIDYSHKDPETKMQRSKVQKYEGAVIDNNFAGWKRMKFKGKDKIKLLKAMKGDYFIDIDFPHTNDSISNEDPVEQIVWKRIPDIVKQPTFTSADTLSNFSKLSIPNKLLKEALMFIFQTHSSKLKELLSQDYCQEGIYELKLYVNGIIENVVIDDFVPTMFGKPLMSGPIKEKQIFLMVIEKALAKACGSYQRIPDDVERLLEMLFCGPLRKTRIQELTDLEKVQPAIEYSIEHKGVAGFFTKNDPKIRNFGLQENELYTILNHHSVHIEDQQPVFLVQLQGQRKFASWNGRFSHNDQIWEKINKEKRHVLFKNLKQNKSFFVGLNDIMRIFENFLAFDGTESRNKDWIEASSEKDYPSFCTFQVKESDDVFIRTTTESKIRSSLIIAEMVSSHNFEYVGGAFSSNDYSLEVTVHLHPGRYIICSNHDWMFNNSGSYSIFLSSHSHALLQKSPDNIYSNFLEILFRNQSLLLRPNADKFDFFTHKKFYSVCNMVPQTGFVYMHVDITGTKKDKLMVKIDQKQLCCYLRVIESEKWEMMEPHRNRELIDISQDGRTDVVIILKNLMFSQDQKRFFPSTAFKIVE